MKEVTKFLYYTLLSVVTVILLVVLGNWLGLLGIIAAFLLPMFVELVRSLAKAKTRWFRSWPEAAMGPGRLPTHSVE